MSIVPAGMHFAIDGGAILDLVQLIYRKRVHIGANSNSFRPWLARSSTQRANHARFSNTRLHLQPQRTQALCHNTRGAHLLKSKFWMLVQITSHGHHIGHKFINIRFQLVGLGHEASWLSSKFEQEILEETISPRFLGVLISPGCIVTFIEVMDITCLYDFPYLIPASGFQTIHLPVNHCKSINASSGRQMVR